MHELSVCQALLNQVADLAANQGAVAIKSITVEVGALSGVDPQLLENAFVVMRRGSCAEHAKLVVLCPKVTLECLACGLESHTSPNRLVCKSCGGFRTKILAGNELRLRTVEMRLGLRVPTPERLRLEL